MSTWLDLLDRANIKPKPNLAGTAPPTVNNDDSPGEDYAIGSRWTDATNDKDYVCTDASTGAANWVETTATGGGGQTDTVGGGTGITNSGNDVDAVLDHDSHTGEVTGATALTITDNAVTLAKMASGTAGALIVYDGSGDPVDIGVGSASDVLTSNASAIPTWETAGAPGAHDLGGASHNADTLANLNTKVTGATLHGAHTGDVTGDEALTIGALKVAEGMIQADAVTLAKLDAGTPGGVIAYDTTTGDPVDVGVGALNQVLTTSTVNQTPTWEDPAGGPATALATTGADVNVDAAAPPTTDQVLKATSATTATWQTDVGSPSPSGFGEFSFDTTVTAYPGVDPGNGNFAVDTGDIVTAEYLYLADLDLGGLNPTFLIVSLFAEDDYINIVKTGDGTISHTLQVNGPIEHPSGYFIIPIDERDRGSDGTGMVNGTNMSFTHLSSSFADRVIVRAEKFSAGTIDPGDVVYLRDYDNGNHWAQVELADATSSTTMPAWGIALETLEGTQEGRVLIQGLSVDDFSGLVVGNPMYISDTPGELSTTPGTIVQQLGIVARSNVLYLNGNHIVAGAGAEVNNLAGDGIQGIADDQVAIGSGAGTAAYHTLPDGAVTYAIGTNTVSQAGLADLSDVTATEGTGSTVLFQGSPNITTPTIGSFVNAGHDHSDAANGGALGDASVTLPKLADMATDSFLGRDTATTGPVEVLSGTTATTLLDLFSTSTATQGLVPGSSGGAATVFLDATGNWSTPAGGGNVSNTGTPLITEYARWTDATTIEGRTKAQTQADLDVETGVDFDPVGTDNSATHTGDVIGDTALTIDALKVATGMIQADAVTYAKMQNVVADDVILGNIGGAGGIVDELTGTEVTALLDEFAKDSGAQGVVPASAGGTSDFLRADGSWQTPGGSGDVTAQNTPNSGEWGKWTSATGLEGRTTSELLTDMSIDGDITTLTIGASATVTGSNTGDGASHAYSAHSDTVPSTDFADDTIAPARIETQGDSGALIFNASGVPAYLGPGSDGDVLTSGGTGVIPSWTGPTGGPATDLATSSSDVAIDSTAPAGANYVLKTTDTTTATWQVAAGGGDVSSTGTTSIAQEIAAYDDTGQKTLGRANVLVGAGTAGTGTRTLGTDAVLVGGRIVNAGLISATEVGGVTLGSVNEITGTASLENDGQGGVAFGSVASATGTAGIKVVGSNGGLVGGLCTQFSSGTSIVQNNASSGAVVWGNAADGSTVEAISASEGASVIGYADDGGILRATGARGAIVHGHAENAGSTIIASKEGALAGGYALGGGDILASGRGSIAHGLVDTSGTITAGVAAFALGEANGSGSISASMEGSLAGGYALSGGVISASGQGSLVWCLGTGSATANNAVQFGTGANGVGDSLQVGDTTDGLRLQAGGTTSTVDGSFWVDGSGNVICRTGGVSQDLGAGGAEVNDLASDGINGIADNQLAVGTSANNAEYQTLVTGAQKFDTATGGFTQAALADLSDVTGDTGTGSTVVFDTSPTIVTPTIASFTGAGHDHADAAGGGALADNSVAPAKVTTQGDSGAFIFNATGVPAYLGPGADGDVLTSGGTGVIPAWTAPTGGAATELATTGAAVNVDAAAPPTTGQILKATTATTATWQPDVGSPSPSGFGEWSYDSTVTAYPGVNPANGEFALDTDDIGTATFMYLNDLDLGGVNPTLPIESLWAQNDYIKIVKTGDGAVAHIIQIGGPIESASGYFIIPIDERDGGDGTMVDTDNMSFTHISSSFADRVIIRAEKGSAGTINPGQIVYLWDYDIGNGWPQVELANASSAATMPAWGVALDEIVGTSQEGRVLVQGLSVDHFAGLTPRDPVYVSDTDGEISDTPGTIVQRIGTAIRGNVVYLNGSNTVDPAGGGDVVGPGTSTANAIALFSDATGILLKDGPALGTDGQILTSGGAGGPPAFEDRDVKPRALTIESPTATEDFSFFFTTVAITVTNVAVAVRGATPSITGTLVYDSARNSGGPTTIHTMSAVTSVTGTDGAPSGTATIPADSYIWLISTAVGAATDELFIGLTFTED
jgi:hypothetical protein